MPISGKGAIKVLAGYGFEISRQKGSHIVLVKKDESGKKIAIVVVPNHKELKTGTLRSISKMSSVPLDKFNK